MNFNVYVDDDTAKELQKLARRKGTSRNMVVREAIAAYLTKNSAQWPAIVLAFEGDPGMPPFESYRDELAPPDDDPLAPRQQAVPRRKKTRKR